MGSLVFIFFVVVSLSTFQLTTPAPNQTDLQVAMNDMRLKSYYGFVILLQMLIDNDPLSLEDNEPTFFMPSDAEISKHVPTPKQLQEFILSHSIPAALPLSNLVHLPTGTLIPSSRPNKLFTITNNGRTSFFLNNAKIVKPNVCTTSIIKCHGISRVITTDYRSSGQASPPGATEEFSDVSDQIMEPPSSIAPESGMSFE